MKIYLRWDMNADSWQGTRTLLSIHTTLEKAEAAVPENLRETFSQDPFPPYVRNFVYEAIEEQEID